MKVRSQAKPAMIRHWNDLCRFELSMLSGTWNCMPRYFFDIKDIKNGPGSIDPVGLDCRNDREAVAKAASLAAEVATVARSAAGKWHLAVLNAERELIGTVPIERNGNHQCPSTTPARVRCVRN
jgi:hypothetical protein